MSTSARPWWPCMPRWLCCQGRPGAHTPCPLSLRPTPGPRAACRFLADKGPLRDAKLKLIPSLAQGSWVVRQAVGQTPVILGKRLKTEYFMENAYLEADVDISANATAAGVTSLVAGAIKSLVFDIGIVLEVPPPPCPQRPPM